MPRRRALAPAPVNGIGERVERIVVSLAREHSKTVVMYYVYVKRRPAPLICHVLGLRFESFAPWLYSCREMVRQRLATSA